MPMKKKLKPRPKAFEEQPEKAGVGRGWIKLVLAWTAVALPLAWGVFKTLEKAAVLFRG